MLRILTLAVFCTIFSVELSAQTCTATGGIWTSAGTWDCGYPFPGGTTDLVIPPGVTVTIPNFTVINFNGTISVYGTLTIGFLSALNMDATSSIQIYTGGTVNGFLSLVLVGGTPVGTFPPLSGPQAIDNSGGGQPLPVELIFFNAKADGETVDLSWATASEENFDYFSIERSANGEDFKEIGTVIGVGNSLNRKDYRLTDNFPLSGKSYYRLKSIDFDGYTEVFDIVLVEMPLRDVDFMIYPNPVQNGIFTIQTNFSIKNDASLYIYNSSGIFEKEFQLISWQEEYNVKGLNSGLYFIKLIASKGSVVRRIQIN